MSWLHFNLFNCSDLKKITDKVNQEQRGSGIVHQSRQVVQANEIAQEISTYFSNLQAAYNKCTVRPSISFILFALIWNYDIDCSLVYNWKKYPSDFEGMYPNFETDVPL